MELLLKDMPHLSLTVCAALSFIAFGLMSWRR